MPSTQTLLPLLAYAFAAVTLSLVLHSGLGARMALDQPNSRSLHARPTPRVGGLVLVPSFLFVWGLLGHGHDPLLYLVALLALLSYCDDRFDLPALLRLAAHVGAALLLALVKWDLGGIILVATALGIVWSTNLFNFMDGADGVAGGMAVCGFFVYGLMAMAAGNRDMTLMCWSVAAAAAGFLLFNFPPARTFMGDAGSIPLGFLAAAIGGQGWQMNLWPGWFPLLVFSPFIVDASVTLLKRLLRGERIWQAHRDHYYQRLVRMGWSHRRLALAAYALMIAVATTACVLLGQNRQLQLSVLLSWAMLYAAAMITIDRRWKQHQAKAGAA